jgi:hypothetical protein
VCRTVDATVARRATGTGGPRDECLDRQVTRVAERALAGAATDLKERERDDRDDEIARLKSKVGEITMDNEQLYAKIAVMEGKRPLGPQEAETMSRALSPSFAHRCGLARVARVWTISRASVYRSLKETPPNTITRRPGPVGGCSDANWQIIFAGK